MDCSVEYIDMCRKAVEVQGIKPNFNEDDQNFVANFHKARACRDHGSDHVWTKYEHEKFCSICGKELVSWDDIPTIETYEENDAMETVWLPRQDQLQGMVERSLSVKSNGNHMAVQFAYFISDHIENHIHFGNVLLQSMEQLWLAFVMHEKYGKKWDGEDWS